jgi:hypothetical protein
LKTIITELRHDKVLWDLKLLFHNHCWVTWGLHEGYVPHIINFGLKNGY